MSQKAKIGFYEGKFNSSIHIPPPDHPKHGDAKSFWHISAPKITGDYDPIQINGKYLADFNGFLIRLYEPCLYSFTNSIPYTTANEIINFLSYINDALFSLQSPHRQYDSDPCTKELLDYFITFGFHDYREQDPQATEQDAVDYIQTNLCASLESAAIDSIEDNFGRLNPTCLKEGFITCCDFPDDEKLKRAFSVYRQALIAIEPTGKILNYWRVLEAVAPCTGRANCKLTQLFNNFLSLNLTPIQCQKTNRLSNNKQFNLITTYKRYVKKYFSILLKTHKSPDKIRKQLYKNRRCPSAHAAKNILEVNNDVTLASLYNDALLLKYIARCAIEQYWSTLI